MSSIPAIPPLSTISDASIKKVLKPLLDGWETRNGTTGDPDQAFVTVADLRNGIDLASSGVKAQVSASSGAVKKSSEGAILVSKLVGASSTAAVETINSTTVNAPSSSVTNTAGSASSAAISGKLYFSNPVAGLNNSYVGGKPYRAKLDVTATAGMSMFITGTEVFNLYRDLMLGGEDVILDVYDSLAPDSATKRKSLFLTVDTKYGNVNYDNGGIVIVTLEVGLTSTPYAAPVRIARMAYSPSHANLCVAQIQAVHTFDTAGKYSIYLCFDTSEGSYTPTVLGQQRPNLIGVAGVSA